MTYFVNGMILDEEEDLYLKKIGEGTEGSVYKVGDLAIKIYDRMSFKVRLGDGAVDILSKLPTNRILMPKHKVTNQFGIFCGYAADYIENIPLNPSTYPIGTFLSELNLYEQDINVLNEAKVSSADMNFDNVVYSKNNGIYMVDPGSFHFFDPTVVNNNKEEINRLFAQILSLGLENEKQCRDLYMALSHYNLSDKIKDTIVDPNEPIRNYAFRMIKRR